METILIIIFATLLAVFCCAGIFAPRFLASSAHSGNEVFEGTVVANDESSSVVRDRGDNLYCLKQVLPEDTEIIFILPNIENEQTAAAYVPIYEATENFIDCARIIRRLNNEYVLCSYRNQKIFVSCAPDVQMRLLQQHNSVAEEKQAFPFILPIRRTDKELMMPICYQND